MFGKRSNKTAVSYSAEEKLFQNKDKADDYPFYLFTFTPGDRNDENLGFLPEQVAVLTSDKVKVRFSVIKLRGKGNVRIELIVDPTTFDGMTDINTSSLKFFEEKLRTKFFVSFVIEPANMLMNQILYTMDNGVYELTYADLAYSSPILTAMRFVVPSALDQTSKRAFVILDYDEEPAVATVDGLTDETIKTISKEVGLLNLDNTWSYSNYDVANELLFSFMNITARDRNTYSLINNKSTVEGSMLVLIGKSQSGKSTLIKHSLVQRKSERANVLGLVKSDKVTYFRVDEPETDEVEGVDTFYDELGNIDTWLTVFLEVALGKNNTIIIDSARTLSDLSNYNLMASGISRDIIGVFSFLPKMATLRGKKLILVHNPLELDKEKISFIVNFLKSTSNVINFDDSSEIILDGKPGIKVRYEYFKRKSPNVHGELIFTFSKDGTITAEEVTSVNEKQEEIAIHHSDKELKSSSFQKVSKIIRKDTNDYDN